MQQQPTLTPQQQAIQVVRTRYEQGILTFDQFEYALNALLVSQTPEQCQRIVEELPSTTATSVLHPPAPASASGKPATQRIVGNIGELKRMQHPWRLEPHTSVRMWIGNIKLDLSLATLPPNGVLEVFVPLGEVVIYVPREVHVTLHASALLGEVNALGEERKGIFARINEEEFPSEGIAATPVPHLEIRLKTIIGNVKVIRVNGPVLALKDMIKEVAGQVILATLDAFKQNRRDKTLPK
jgi:Cell wall-active antibiotics response LiaF, C-terminal